MFGRQDARQVDDEYEAERQWDDLGYHRVEDLPLGGDKKRRDRGFDPYRELPRGRQTLAKANGGKPEVQAKWAALYDEEQDMTRADGIGGGDLHRMGENYRPSYRQQRARSVETPRRRPQESFQPRPAANKPTRIYGAFGPPGEPSPGNARRDPYQSVFGGPAAPLVGPPRPQRVWGGQLAGAADFTSMFGALLGKNAPAAAPTAPANPVLMQSRHAPVVEDPTPKGPARPTADWGETAKAVGGILEKTGPAGLMQSKHAPLQPVPTQPAGTKEPAPTPAPTKAQETGSSKALLLPGTAQMINGNIKIYAGDLVNGFINSVIQVSYPQFYLIEGLEELLRKFRQIVLSPELLTAAINTIPGKETAEKLKESSPLMQFEKVQGRILDAVHNADKTSESGKAKSAPSTSKAEQPKVEISNAFAAPPVPAVVIKQEKPIAAEQNKPALSTAQNKEISVEHKVNQLPPHLARKSEAATPENPKVAASPAAPKVGSGWGEVKESTWDSKPKPNMAAFQASVKPNPPPVVIKQEPAWESKPVAPPVQKAETSGKASIWAPVGGPEKKSEGPAVGNKADKLEESSVDENEEAIVARAIAGHIGTMRRIAGKDKEAVKESKGPEKEQPRNVVPVAVRPQPVQATVNIPANVAPVAVRPQPVQTVVNAPPAIVVKEPESTAAKVEKREERPQPPREQQKVPLKIAPQPQPQPFRRDHAPPRYGGAQAKTPTIAPADPSVALRARKLQLSKEKPWTMKVTIDVSREIPHCGAYKLIINCTADPMSELTLSLRSRLDEQEFNSVSTSSAFQEYAGKVTDAFDDRMCKMWGEEFRTSRK